MTTQTIAVPVRLTTGLGPVESAVTVTKVVFFSSETALKARTPTPYVSPSVRLVRMAWNEFKNPDENGTVTAGDE